MSQSRVASLCTSFYAFTIATQVLFLFSVCYSIIKRLVIISALNTHKTKFICETAKLEIYKGGKVKDNYLLSVFSGIDSQNNNGAF